MPVGRVPEKELPEQSEFASQKTTESEKEEDKIFVIDSEDLP